MVNQTILLGLFSLAYFSTIVVSQGSSRPHLEASTTTVIKEGYPYLQIVCTVGPLQHPDSYLFLGITKFLYGHTNYLVKSFINGTVEKRGLGPNDVVKSGLDNELGGYVSIRIYKPGSTSKGQYQCESHFTSPESEKALVHLSRGLYIDFKNCCLKTSDAFSALSTQYTFLDSINRYNVQKYFKDMSTGETGSDNMNKIITELREKVEMLEKKSNEMTEVKENQTLINNDIQKLKENITELPNQMNVSVLDNSTLTKIEEVLTDVPEKVEGLKNLQDDYEKINKTVSSVREKINIMEEKLNNKIINMSNNLTNISEKIESLQNTLAGDLETNQNKTITQESGNSDSQHEYLNNKINELNRTMSSMPGIIDQIQKEMNNNTSELKNNLKEFPEQLETIQKNMESEIKKLNDSLRGDLDEHFKTALDEHRNETEISTLKSLDEINEKIGNNSRKIIEILDLFPVHVEKVNAVVVSEVEGINKSLIEVKERLFQSDATCEKTDRLYNMTGAHLYEHLSFGMSSYSYGYMKSATILRRVSNKVNFDLTYKEYEDGFGEMDGDFWIGLSKMHELTKYFTELRVTMIDSYKGNRTIHRWKSFNVGDKASGYELTVDGFTGDKADNVLQYHSGMKFTTKDKDQDHSPGENCAQTSSGGWWYRDCLYVNPCGVFDSTEHLKGVIWKKVTSFTESLHYIDFTIVRQ